MDLCQLRYFIALAEHRSFIHVASVTSITQSAFSRSIQGLEQELDYQLVDRGSKDLRPTPEGQVALQHALSLAQGSTNPIHEIAQLDKLSAGELRFGNGPASARQLVSDTITDFINRHPRVQISLDMDDQEKLSRSLLRKEIEFLVTDIRDFEADPSFQTRLLAPRRGRFFCCPQHPLLGKNSLPANNLFNYPLTLTLIPPDIREPLAGLSDKVDFVANIRCGSIHVLIRIIRQTDATGTTSDETLYPYLQRGGLQSLQWCNLLQNLDNPNARCGIISRGGYRLSTMAKAMIEILVELNQTQHAAV